MTSCFFSRGQVDNGFVTSRCTSIAQPPMAFSLEATDTTTRQKDAEMKTRVIAISASLLLMTSFVHGGESALCVQIGRYLGWGINDGYHANRDCLPMCMPCNSCSPVGQPMMATPYQSKSAAGLVPRQAAPMYPANYGPMMQPTLAQPTHWRAASTQGRSWQYAPTVANPTRGTTPRW